MLHLILYEPEIPPNTGNLIRLTANAGVALHLIEPLGFTLETKALRRAGLDYRDMASVTVHRNFEDWLATLSARQRVLALTTRASRLYAEVSYRSDDCLLCGPESRGLPDEALHHDRIAERIRIPMQHGSRSLNLSNAASIVTYEALRQLGFPALERSTAPQN
ncbi:MAG: tRNA (uridine(34)/cytosine(34)/5-carboxymethylaminomethyluridine(34)-2'-O)-methyltransferase TrmL [Gammaproteobacteria bacterium]|nr:MAG: tRNA (uridine(34)/cytosine(34)/5-carboxymethylaminomethyluridine(34)-2'-O)-methyltransferase TrmL [Gammaproteobacteria bacterium]